MEKYKPCYLISVICYKPSNCKFMKVLNMSKITNRDNSAIMHFQSLKFCRGPFLNQINKISMNEVNQNFERPQPAPLL